MRRPVSTKIKVFRDDGGWDAGLWFLRGWGFLRDLFVCEYRLAESADGDYCGDWEADSAFLLAEHPDHIFVYA